jgi:hypothetical protein
VKRNTSLGELAILFVYLAALFTMVRPNSQGPTLVKNFTDGFGNIIKAATGGGSF